MKINIICALLLLQTYLGATQSLKYPTSENGNYHASYSIELPKNNPEERLENKWVVYLSNKVNPYDLLQFDPIILSPNQHPELAPLIVKNKNILARISLGDIERKDPYFVELKNENLLIGTNPVAPGRQIIDLRSPVWNEIILQKILPNSISDGFTGFCLCNLDACINLEYQDPEKYGGMLEAALTLLEKIRSAYPKARIMLDLTGLLHKTGAFSEYYDYAYFENLFTQTNAKSRKLTTAERYFLITERLQQVKKEHPVHTLDFWSFKDPQVVNHMYKQLRNEGFCPYVAERLDVLYHAI